MMDRCPKCGAELVGYRGDREEYACGSVHGDEFSSAVCYEGELDERRAEIAALRAENERLREQEKHWEAAAEKATAAVEADNDRLRALLTDVLYCQLGGHLNPNKTGRKMLDRIRSEVT